jgi:hypothetical protein
LDRVSNCDGGHIIPRYSQIGAAGVLNGVIVNSAHSARGVSDEVFYSDSSLVVGDLN